MLDNLKSRRRVVAAIASRGSGLPTNLGMVQDGRERDGGAADKDLLCPVRRGRTTIGPMPPRFEPLRLPRGFGFAGGPAHRAPRLTALNAVLLTALLSPKWLML